MPPYLTRKDHTYYFRQSVPAELRAIVGKREIKKSLGRDFSQAVRACKREAVKADAVIAEARAKLASIPVDPYSSEGIRRTEFVPLKGLTPTLEQEFANLVRESLLDTDQKVRIKGMNAVAFEAYGNEINASVTALRQQLSTGRVSPMIPSAQHVLFGRGYSPELSDEDWRRIAYIMTQSTLEAYEAIAARQKGAVVKLNDERILSSQFEVQNAERVRAQSKKAVTWEKCYEIWVNQCFRPDDTLNAYLAAMKLFIEATGKQPNQVSREDVLGFRGYLQKNYKLAPGTVRNKIGFVGTIFAAARDSKEYVKELPGNPFERIKVTKPKGGVKEEKRLPFDDEDLAKIFGADLYTKRSRPKGGGGEGAVWIPAIAYLTGMSLEEIAVLTVKQFHTDAKGNPYLQVGDGKNANRADRQVPIHPALIQAGLLRYVKTCRDRLFPKVESTANKASKAYSQWFGRHLTKLGITSKSKVFHSFRHLFKDLCRDAGLDDSAIDQICGHEPESVGGKYGKGRRLVVLAGLIAKVAPPIPLPKIFPPH